MNRLLVTARWCLAAVLATTSPPADALPRVLAREREELETDRDAFTFAPTTAGGGTSILETSYSFLDNRIGPETHSVPEVLVRRGLGDRVEARLGFNYEAGGPGRGSGRAVLKPTASVVGVPIGILAAATTVASRCLSARRGCLTGDAGGRMPPALRGHARTTVPMACRRAAAE